MRIYNELEGLTGPSKFIRAGPIFTLRCTYCGRSFVTYVNYMSSGNLVGESSPAQRAADSKASTCFSVSQAAKWFKPQPDQWFLAESVGISFQ